MEELRTFEGALNRLVHDTMVHLVRGTGPLRLVRVAIDPSWDADAFAAGMRAAYAERGHPDVEIMVLPATKDPRLLSVRIG